MKVDLEHLSYDTLVVILEDLNAVNIDLNEENERPSTDIATEQEEHRRTQETSREWESKYYNKLEPHSTRYSDEERIKRSVLQNIIDGTTKLSDAQAVAVFGLVSESGMKIMAVKAHRRRFGTGLIEAKEAIERWMF